MARTLRDVGVPRGRTAPAFGGLLRSLRETRLKKRGSLEQVVTMLAERGMSGVSTTTIWRYERGRPPDVGVLWHLAAIYQADFKELVTRLADELSGAPAPAIEPAIRLDAGQREWLDVYDGLREYPDRRAQMLHTARLLVPAFGPPATGPLVARRTAAGRHRADDIERTRKSGGHR